jgi:Zn-dependent protease with chaperone function
MEELTWLREFGRYLTFRRKRILLISVIILGIIPGTLIFSLPLTVRLIYAIVFISLTLVPVWSTLQLTVNPVLLQVQMWFYNRRHKSTEIVYSGIKRREIKKMAKKIGLDYDKAVYVTDNPLVTSPFVNLFTRKIVIPLLWLTKFHVTEIKAAIGHELGHIKYRSKMMRDMLLTAVAPIIFALALIASTSLLGMFIIPVFCQIAAFAFTILLLSFTLWRNEYRADEAGATIAGAEPLISVFQALEKPGEKDDGSDTHPPLRERIKRLYALLA